MNRSDYIRLIDDSEIEQIRLAAMRILCNSGFGIHNRKLLEILESKGFQVDFNHKMVKVTPELFGILEECARRSSRKGASAELVSRRYEDSMKTSADAVMRRPVHKGFSLGRNITSIYDFISGTKRLATSSDNARILKALHMLPEAAALAPLYTADDIPAEIEPIQSLAEAFLLTDKPFSGIEIMMPGQLPYIEELHSIKEGGRTVRYTHSFASMTKFTIDPRAAACLVEVAERNGLKEWGSNSCPIAGISAPVTIAGAAALGMAEMIGGWIPGWALNEDVTLCAIPVSAMLDMKTTRVMFAAPEAVLIDSVLNQVFMALYGMSLNPQVTATYIDGKTPGFHAVHDKVYKSLSFLAFTGCEIGSHFGMLESGATLCPAQLMLDFDINRSMQVLVEGVQVNEDTLALEVIDEVGVHGDFVSSDHTFEHFRTALWSPTLFDRSSFIDPIIELGREKEILMQAQARYEEAYSLYQPIELEVNDRKSIEDVVTRARRHLLKG